MDCTARYINYQQTGYFSKLVTDYISGNKLLQPFYKHPVSLEGIRSAIEERKKYPTDRQLLVDALTKQYASNETSGKVKANIDKLLLQNTFTITTAHQPNILTGPLYFIYKILHAIKLAEFLAAQIPDLDFIPVYYMGSEDADLDELGHVFIDGEKHEWQTRQSGAVGRMKVDKALIKLIDIIAGEVLVNPFGTAIIDVMKDCYKEGVTVEQATFKLVNELFKDYGLIILLPDNAELKKAFIPVIEKELTEGFSHKIVAETANAFPKEYKVQASGREINLFYLLDDKRERIEKVNGQWSIVNSAAKFNAEEFKNELYNNPERFSPNVILRPVFQELILPNIAFIGGGGELAYWLELQNVFETVNVPYPVLILRNSFLFVDEDQSAVASRLGFGITDLFKKETDLLNELVKRETTVQLSLEKEKQTLTNFYEQLKEVSGAVDVSLIKHTEALQAKALKKIAALEKKLLKAEKKKFDAQQRQLHKLKAVLFPNDNLQERIDNIIPYYAKWGPDFIQLLHKNSKGLEQEFGIVESW